MGAKPPNRIAEGNFFLLWKSIFYFSLFAEDGLSSAFFATTFDNEFVHNLILFFAIPISLFALALGYKNHGALSYFLVGTIGLIILIVAVILGEPLYGETGEILFTMLGSVFVVFAHYKNHQICKEINCSCHDD